MGSKNAGANKADKANKQVQKQQDAIQANEAKEVRSTPFGRSLGRGLADTSKYSGGLRGAIEKANFRNSTLGRNPSLNQLADPLGRSGLTTDEYGRVRNTGEYNVTPGGMQDNIQGTLGSRDISQLGRMIDSGNFANLNEQAAANQLFGFNPTQNMGFLDSAKYQFTNPEFKRDTQRLGNLAKGIGMLSPVQNIVRSLFKMDPVKMNAINPYNIDPRFSEYDRFNPYSDEDLEGMTNPAIYDRLFNQAAEQVAPSPFMGRTEDYQFTGGTPPVDIQDNFKINPDIYDPDLNVGLDPDQVGRDIMVNPEKGINSIAAEQLTNPDSIVNLMNDAMGVNTTSQQTGQALTDTLPFSGYFADMYPDTGSGDLPASEMGAFSNMQDTNTFNLFNPDTYPSLGSIFSTDDNQFAPFVSENYNTIFDKKIQ